MSTPEDLISQFGDAVKLADVQTEALSICRIYSLSAEDLKYKWDAFAYQITNTVAAAGATSKREEPEFNLENLRELRKEIQSSVKPVKLEAGTPAAPPRNALRKSLARGGIDGLLDGLSTPAAKRRSIGSPSAAGMGTPVSATKSMSTPRPSTLSASTSRETQMTTPDKLQLSPSSNSNRTPTALSPTHKPLFTTPAPSKFESRNNALSIVESLNAHLSLPTPVSSLSPRVKLASSTNPKDYAYRYMFEKLLDRAEALDNRIDEAAEMIRQYHEIEEELGDPGVDSQEDMVCVGRVCTDLYAAKLQDGQDKSKTSVWFESSRLMGAGARIELRFDEDVKVRGHEVGDGGAGMFPGAIIGVRGRNVGGQFFNVKEILMMPPMYLPASMPQDLMDYHHSDTKLGGRPLSVMVAAGPYTTDDNLDFIPLDALISEARSTKPDTLILIGPFIDSNHPSIRSGDIAYAPPQIFAAQISARISNLMESSPGTNIILIPSHRDVLSSHVVFPQAPLERDPEMGLPKRVKLLPNPATFSINEVNFAISSADVLFPLRSQEFLKEAPPANPEEASLHEGAGKDHVGRVCRHVLRQRSFYPIFPPPLSGAGVDGVNLDVTHMDLLKFDGFGADVVILPSMLGKHFVKTVDSTIMVNPSFLTRGSNGGTFTRFAVHPFSKDELRTELSKAAMSAEQHATENKVYERCRVDIVRI